MKLTSPIAIVLDTAPLGLLTQKLGIAEADTCRLWPVKRYGCDGKRWAFVGTDECGFVERYWVLRCYKR